MGAGPRRAASAQGTPVRLTVTTHSEAETVALGRRLGAALQAGDVVALTGDLGTGKTALARGIAAGAGARGYVASPTFTLIREYRGRVPVFHVDLYRLDPGDLATLGLEEVLEAGITVIEWAEKAEAFLRPPLLRVHLAFGDAPEERVLTLEARGRGPEAALANLEAVPTE